MDLYYTIRFDNGAIVVAKASEECEYKKHQYCVIKRDFYFDYGQVAILHGTKQPEDQVGEAADMVRVADDQDKANGEINLEKARNSFRSAVEQVELLKLPMKLLNCHHSLDNKLITIQFTADGRVDFRELVKELSRILGSRIELRQIGVRDEAAICGGIGICGEELCCRRFLKEFNSINVRMAKDQDLSLTPGTISGACGRLKCCLKFEHEGYVELEKSMPKRGDFCSCCDGKGRVVDRNLLTGKVTLQVDQHGHCQVYDREDVKVINNNNRNRHNNSGRDKESKDSK